MVRSLAFLFSAALPALAAFEGTVIDAVTRAPVAGVTVRNADGTGPVITTTDAQGRYVLPVGSLARIPRSSTGTGMARLLAFGQLPASEPAFDASGRVAAPAAFARSLLLVLGGASAPVAAGPAAARTSALTRLLAFEIAGYKPREAVATDGDPDTVALVPETAMRYFHRMPVDAGDGWTPGDVNAAFPQPKALLDAMDSLAARRYKEVHSLLVVKGGKLVLEEYYKGNIDTIDFEKGIKRVPLGSAHWTRTGKHYVASVNKAITSIITGMALAKAGKPVTTPLVQLLPAYADRFTGTKANITVEHALTMTLGFQWDEWAGRDLADMWATQDIGAYVLAKNMAAAPGTQWIYNSAGPNLLHAAVPALTGRDAAAFATAELFEPLGITDLKWGKQPNGTAEGSAKMFLRPRDLAKLGYLYLKGGQWNGRQVVPAEWVQASTAFKRSALPKSPNDYAYLWWVRKQTTPKGTVVSYYQAEGDGGNYIVVVPAHDLVVVATGGNYGDFVTYDTQMSRLMARHVLPAVGL